MIGIPISEQDKESIKSITDELCCGKIDLKVSVYKNRRGRYKDILLWCSTDLGTCRIEPQFATDYNYNLVNIEDLKIEVSPLEE